MSGGKETPRQKMIGLMYLVLMALLALNVTKEVLNAFVAIEENVQKGALTQFERGEASKADLVEAKNDISLEKVKKVKYFLSIIEKIDKETALRIKEIDDLKLDILKKSGEKAEIAKDKDKEAILWKSYSTKEPLKPARLNLMAVEAKDQFDIPMHTIIGEDLTNITGSGKALWENYNNYRNSICNLVGTYSPPAGKVWNFKSSHINNFKDNADLVKQVDKMMAKNKYNDKDDAEVIKQLYMELTKNERYDSEESKNIHWIGKTFDHSPLVAALASLTSLQQEILSARATAVTHIKNRVSTGEYSFNKVVGLAYGPSIANAGEEIDLSIMMAAFDSDNQPTISGPGITTYPGNGQGKLKVKVSGNNEMVLNGTVSIKKKSGEIKTEKWSHTVKIMKPQGTISLPQLNVLYRNYPNRIIGVASGYEKTILVGTDGLILKQNGQEYIGEPGRGQICSIQIFGKNTTTNKQVSLGKSTYKVMNLPKPALYLGKMESTGTVSAIKNEKRLFAHFGEGIPLAATFDIVSYQITVDGHKSDLEKGYVLSPKAIQLLKMVKEGSIVTIIATYKGSGYQGKIPCTIIASK